MQSTTSKQSATSHTLAPLLLGIIIVYQIVYHIFLHQAAVQEEEHFDPDGACSVTAGANGYSALCMEAQLFQGWHELPAESSSELDSLLAVSPNATETVAPLASPDDAATNISPNGQALRGSVDAAAPDASAETKPQALEGLLWDLAWKMGGGDQSHEAPQKHHQAREASKHETHHPKQPAFMARQAPKKQKQKLTSHGLAKLQKGLNTKLHDRARRRAEHKALRDLSVAVNQGRSNESQSTDEHTTSWAQGLMNEMHEMEAHLQHLHDKRTDHASAFASAFKAYAATEQAKKSQQDPLTPWAHSLDDLTHDIQHHMEVREKERAEHAAARKAAHNARLRAAHAEIEKTIKPDSLLDRIQSFGQEICQDPQRRDTPACGRFLAQQMEAGAHTHASPRDAIADVKEHTRLMEKHMEQLHRDQKHDDEEIRKESMEFLKELCADRARQSYPTCAHLSSGAGAEKTKPKSALRASVTTTSAAVTSSPSRLRASSTLAAEHVHQTDKIIGALQWTPMKDADVVKQPHHMGAPAVLMARKELRAHHWQGKIPKVACITILPEGKVTENLMRYFMDNYNLQHYEGPRELILVYHSSDTEAARIAHLYADGTSIKVAATHGLDQYPSATAYRYGAWIGRDADLVARWDFEGFNHPNRLSMQIRAIALSKRPASLIPRVTAFDADGKHVVVSNTGFAHGSLVGDAAWMRRHWMPLLEEESAILHSLNSGDVTQVAMPELLSYHDASALKATTGS
jgi:hypothetical protein